MAEEQTTAEQVEEESFKPSSPTSKLNFKDGWTYDDAPQSIDHVKIDDQYGHFIDGTFQEPVKGRYLPSINPATEEELSSIAEGTQQDVDKAVKSARKA
jgi:aldehyde dehydrogenase (NAD+)